MQIQANLYGGVTRLERKDKEWPSEPLERDGKTPKHAFNSKTKGAELELARGSRGGAVDCYIAAAEIANRAGMTEQAREAASRAIDILQGYNPERAAVMRKAWKIS